MAKCLWYSALTVLSGRVRKMLTSLIPEFDVPVLHVERVQHTYAKPNIVTEAQKLMHRFTVEEVEAKIDATEQGSP